MANSTKYASLHRQGLTKRVQTN